MWICLALFRHCSQAQVFQPLPSLQLLVPFHLPGNAAAGKTIKIKGANKIASLPKNQSDHSYNQSKVGSLNLVYLWVFHGSPQAIDYILIGGATCSSTHLETFNYTSVF